MEPISFSAPLAASLDYVEIIRQKFLTVLGDMPQEFEPIVREESRDYETNTYSVVEHTKTHRDRFIPLVPKAIELMDEILAVSDGQEYLFERDGCRITSRQINYVLEKFARKAGLDPKRSHKIRKTVASTLNANGLPVDAIRVLLGHSNLQTTMAYLYNPLTNDETYGRMACAL